MKAARRPSNAILSLYDVARTFSRRIPLSRLVQIEPDIRPYLASVLVAAMQEAKDTLTVPADVKLRVVSPDQFQAHLLELATKKYKTYSILQQLS